MKLRKLQDALTSSDPEARRQAVSEAAESGTEETGLLLVGALADGDWRVRAEASRVLSQGYAHPAVSRRLVEVLVDEEDVGFRNAAVEALGRRGESSVGVLQDKLAELDADGRKLAAEALARTASTAAFGPLEQLAGDEDVNVRVAAIEAVAQVGLTAPERALPILDEALGSNHHFVRLAALDAIRRLGLSLPWQILERLFETPALVLSGLQLAAVVDEARAAAFYVREFELASGKSWSVCLKSACRYAEHSETNRAALREALGELSADALSSIEAAARGGGADAGKALMVLCLRGGPLAVECTTALLGKEEHAPLVADCVDLLGASALEALTRSLAAPDGAVRAHAVELLGLLASDGGLRSAILSVLRPCAADSSPLVVRAWLRVITQVGAEEDLRVVVDQLGTTTDPAMWRVVTPALEASGLRFPEVAAQLARGIGPEDKLATAVAVLIGVVPEPLMGSHEENVEWLVAALRNRSAAVRMAAVEVLGSVDDPAAIPALGNALSDSEPPVQMSAVRSLGRVASGGDEAARQKLLQLAVDSRNVGLVVAALQALGEAHDLALVGRLTPLLEHPDAWRASAAVAALAGYPAEVRTKTLLRALHHVEADVVKSAIELIEPEAAVVSELAACLEHSVWEVRRAAADQLGASNSQAAGSALKARLADEKEPLVVAAIYRSLAKLASHEAINWSMLPPESGRDW